MRNLKFAAQMRRSVTCAFAQQISDCAGRNKMPIIRASQMFLPAQMRKCARKNTLSVPSLSRPVTDDGFSASSAYHPAFLDATHLFSFYLFVSKHTNHSKATTRSFNHAFLVPVPAYCTRPNHTITKMQPWPQHFVALAAH
jgi:hypothetical protein